MERRRWNYLILVVKRDDEYHIRINNRWEPWATFDNEEEAKNYACWFVDCLDEIENMFKNMFARI